MTRLWVIAKHHFRQEAGKRSFLLVLLSLPLFLVLTVGIGLLFADLEQGRTTLGYVDPGGFLDSSGSLDTGGSLDQSLADSGAKRVTLRAFASASLAASALESGEIDAYYLLPEGYPLSRQAELIYVEPPRHDALRHFEDTVRRELVKDLDSDVARRILEGPSVSFRAIETNREFPPGGPDVGYFVPVALAAIFVFLMLTTSSYLMQVIVVEKENRTMEVVVSSVSTGTLISGKTVGTLGLALVQLVVWLLFLLVTVWLGGSLLGVEWLQNVQLHWADVARVILVAVPSFFCIGALMTLVGTSMLDSQEVQQAGGLFFLPMFAPLWLAFLLFQNPDGALAVGLSLFPMTSVMTMALRSLFMRIPVWEVVAAACISLLLGLLFVWLTGKAVRLSMLRYGQRLSLRELLGRSEARSGALAPRAEVRS